MALVFPTITIIANPVTVIMGTPALTYQMFLQMLQYTSYDVTNIYFKAVSFDQYQQPYNYLRSDVAGTAFNKSMFALTDPDQAQPSMQLELPKNGLVIDNSTTLSFNLMPNENMQIEVWANTASFEYILHQPLVDEETEKRNKQVEQERLQQQKSNFLFNTLLLTLVTVIVYAACTKNKGEG